MIRNIRFLTLYFVAVLVGCDSSDDLADIQQFIITEKGRPIVGVDVISDLAPIPNFIYKASNLRSPFKPSSDITEKKLSLRRNTIKPDENRIKHFLESIDIADMTMVGTLMNSQNTFALIRASNRIHKVKKGDYLGRNHGRIITIHKFKITLMEIVSSSEDSWIEKSRDLLLKNPD